MKQAITNKGFLRSDTREHVGQNKPIKGEDGYIDELSRLGLVREVQAVAAAPENKARPQKPIGEKSSASPAGQASRRRSARKSAAGVKPEADAE